MKKKTLIILLVVASLFACINIKPIGVKADSGFDSSYSSGGGFSSGSSSYSSGSSWSSSSSSRDYSYSGSGSGYRSSSGDAASAFIALIIIFGIIILVIIKSKGQNLPGFNLDHSKELSDDEVKKYIKDFDKDKFLMNRYNDYVKVQEDWMNFEYESLRSNLTDELYNQYEMQLDTLKVKNEKNVMKNFVYKDSMITKVSEENKQITVTMELVVSFIDYIEQNGNAVRGSSTRPITQHYEITFVLSSVKLDSCPNCGAKLKNNASQTCEYCGSKISKVGEKAVMSKKESLGQR